VALTTLFINQSSTILGGLAGGWAKNLPWHTILGTKWWRRNWWWWLIARLLVEPRPRWQVTFASTCNSTTLLRILGSTRVALRYFWLFSEPILREGKWIKWISLSRANSWERERESKFEIVLGEWGAQWKSMEDFDGHFKLNHTESSITGSHGPRCKGHDTIQCTGRPGRVGDKTGKFYRPFYSESMEYTSI